MTYAKRIFAEFYQTASGKEPVRDWLFELTNEDRKLIGEDIKTVEFGWPLGMPTCRPLGEGVFEVRSTLSGNRISRVLFMVLDGHMVLLHAFIKKTQKTPSEDLDMARRRRKDVLES
jgi:phage-related protein